MEKLDPPLKRHLMGKLPTHSGTENLASNFQGLDPNALLYVFSNAGLLTLEYKPTRAAVEEGLIDTCEGKALWRLDAVGEKLAELGMVMGRQVVNQDIRDDSDGTPRWVNLGTVATYFNVTANTIGKWLDALELRDDEGMGSGEALDRGLCTVSEMNAGGKKTRKISMWNLYPVQRVLVEAGHPLDFDYGRTLKASGKNSDVQVATMDDRAQQMAQEFMALFKDRTTRHRAVSLAKSTPRPILARAENLLNRPGFFTEGTYLKYSR